MKSEVGRNTFYLLGFRETITIFAILEGGRNGDIVDGIASGCKPSSSI